MFNPLKAAQGVASGAGDMAKLVNEARKLQNALKEIVINEQKGRAEVELTADMKIRSVKINGEEYNDLKDCLNDAIEKAQKKAAAKMQEAGGLGSLLGGR